ncbi:LysE family transporter [Streptomyces sp. NBC_01727]|uniref:LysE family transporter n=1 Tax=Streptomyces sp. NBC_01727 TaxID=2975924 RepID=UPI002E10B67E|nr:LysE family transporter [Streptomyces sp. NBC_01727]
MACIAAVAVARSPRAGVMSAIDMALGMAAQVAAAAFRLAMLISTVRWALDVVRLAGSGFLAWFAISTLRSARRAGSPEHVSPTGRQIPRPAAIGRGCEKQVVVVDVLDARGWAGRYRRRIDRAQAHGIHHELRNVRVRLFAGRLGREHQAFVQKQLGN